MTKAERIFKENFTETINYLETWGMDRPFDAWNRLSDSEDEHICRRTINAILAICDSKEREVDFLARHGMEIWKGEEMQRKAVQIIRNTCNNWIKEEAEFFATV